MKLTKLLGIGAAGLISAGLVVWLRAGALPEVTIAMNDHGLTSLKADKVDFLLTGDFRVEEVLLKKAGGTTYQGSTIGTAVCDPEHRELTVTYPWGVVKTSYAAEKGRLTLAITADNTSAGYYSGNTLHALGLEISR